MSEKELKEYEDLVILPLKKMLDDYELRELSKKKGGIEIILERDGVEIEFRMKRKTVLK